MAQTQPVSTDHDEKLARVLDEVARNRLDAEAACRLYPELAAELRHLLAIGQMVDYCAQPVAETTHVYPNEPAPAARAEPLPRAFGAYELREVLGLGGMGIVYKAWDQKLERFVAIKMALRGLRASDTELGRFRAEAQAAAALAHPNIVPVYQVGEQEGQPYFCMKYVPGQTLAQVVAEGPLAPRVAAALVEHIARAVLHAHEKGVLHRDLKPANVLLERDAASKLDFANPQITDFGLAKRIEGGVSLTGTGAIVGTPSYMAPEQAAGSGRPSGPAADIYSLGALLYELLTGRPPFLAASAVETLLLVRSEDPVRPRLLNPRIDLDLEFICRKCLEKQPSHRYASAGKLADDLAAFRQGDFVAARTSSLVSFVTRLFRETHHANVQENWGLLWIWHSGLLMLLCAVTSAIYVAGARSHWLFLGLWGIGLVAWGAYFWHLRRRGGPVTFVERQIAHAWGAGVAASIGIFIVEAALGLEVLYLAPVLPVIAGMVFVVMAGTLAGWFYVAAGLSFAAAVPMALVGAPVGLLVFGIVSAIGFLVPGLKYYRRGPRAADDKLKN